MYNHVQILVDTFLSLSLSETETFTALVEWKNLYHKIYVDMISWVVVITTA